MGRDQHYTFIYEYTVRSAALYQNISQTNDPGGRATGIANTTYFNLGIDYSPVKDLSMSLDGFMLQATETAGIPNLNKPGTEVDDDLGWEVDFKASYKIVKNLTYFVQAGYFDSGDFYDDVMGGKNEGVTQLMHGLQLDF
jgi:predicted porin